MQPSASIAVPTAGAGAPSGRGARTDAELILCPYCDTVHRRARLRGGGRCATCDSRLYRGREELAPMIALLVVAVVGFIAATTFPLVELTAGQTTIRATLFEAISVASEGTLPLASLVLAISLVIAPLLELLALAYVAVPLALGVIPPQFGKAMRALEILRPWRMVEVFLLGVAVAIVKLGSIAKATPEWGIIGIAGMAVAFAALGTFDREALWRAAERVEKEPA